VPVPQTARRAHIEAWLQAHSGPHARKAIEQGTGLTHLWDTLRHMCANGRLVKVCTGFYQGRDPDA
jgi:hypothetical protein